MRNSVFAAGLLALASRALAQVASVCPESNVCFKLNIPANTASSGGGDIFFQISAPSSYEWVSLGQGSGMTGANIFVIYTNSGGNNVTLSPRLGKGHSMPTFNSNAQVTLLEGSGVSGGNMVANVKCSNCNSWSGGSADFTASSGSWIYGYKTGGAMNSNDQSASISQHDSASAFKWSYASAKGGNSVNPLVSSGSTASGTSAAGGASATTSCVPRPTTGTFTAGGAAASTTGGAVATKTSGENENESESGRHRTTAVGASQSAATASPTGEDHGGHHGGYKREINYCDSTTSNSGNGYTPLGASSTVTQTKKMLIAHGTMAALAFVIFFPSGAIAIRLASFPGVVWFHAAFQAFAYLVYIVAFGLGIYIANQEQLLNNYHPIIGIVVFIGLFFQPIFGFLHHSLFKKYGHRTLWSYSHLWLGRAVITLGIINGGLGFKLANTLGMGSRTGMIVYSVVAGIMWLAWVAASVVGEMRRRKSGASDRPPKYIQTDSPRVENRELEDIPPPPEGHYAPRR